MMRVRVLLALGFAVSLPGGLAAEDTAEPPCRIWTAEVDAQGIATTRGECRFAVAPERVVEILREPERLARALSTLAEARALEGGRVLQVHHVGWPIDDRQVTLDWRAQALAEGGWRFSFSRSGQQEPLAEGRVAIEIDDGWWEVRDDGQGGTALGYAVRYDAGGRLEPWLVRRFQSEGIARSLDELGRAARAAIAPLPASRGD